MTTAAQLRSRYAREAVTTASPVRLVTMLYDRLVRDLDDAELAISLADPQAAHAQLRHAQDIVQELSSSLDVSRWEGGRGPAAPLHLAARAARRRQRVQGRHDRRRVPRGRRAAARRVARGCEPARRRLMNSSWLSTLDAFDRHLRLQAQLVDEGRYDEVVAFEPPADLPALPRVFVARAVELHDRAQALSERVARPARPGPPATRRTAPAGARHAGRVRLPRPAGLTSLRCRARWPMGEAALSSS